MAKLTIRHADVNKALQAITAAGMARAGAMLAKKCNERIRINNADGWYRSLPGESPHHSSTGPDKRVIWEVVPGAGGKLPRVIVGITEGNEHLLMLEVGTAPHVIRPKRAKLLRIPWRAEGRGRRQPTDEEIERLGLRPVGEVFRKHSKGKGLRGSQTEWVYFLEQANHPGTAPRPWLVPTVMENLKQIGAMFAGTGVSLNLAKYLTSADNATQLTERFRAYSGQLPIEPRTMPPVGPVPAPPLQQMPAREIGPRTLPPML